MFKSVLIANRGEIACRVIRTAKALGLHTVAVYSEADEGALHTVLADEAHLIGPAPAAQSYLAAKKILAVAKQSKAECIHPGYGFLSENAAFAEACVKQDVTFVGPPAKAIRAMGLKDGAKALMEKAGVPVVPGYHGDKQDKAFLKEKAYEIGYPVLIKAVAGGGGKGMRRVDNHRDFDDALAGAQREAKGAFGDARVLIEKFVTSPRHIEIQVFADSHGNAVHLFERDCSLQRRHQKVIEEAPAPGMTDEMRAAMGEAAVKAALAVGYTGAGTVEFIADGSKGLKKDRFWFMEMNTRLQVEHPVTEAVTGLDLVEWQFRVAAGEPLPKTQDNVALNGHAVEARLYAEDPDNQFLPSTGRLVALDIPAGAGIRIDSGIRAGDAVSPFYDPMIAKVIAHGATRDEALDRLAATMRGTVVAGVRSNAAFAAALAEHADFRAGKFDTGFIERNLKALTAVDDAGRKALAACGVLRLLERRAAARDGGASPWAAADGWRLSGGAREQSMDVFVDGAPMRFDVDWRGGHPALADEAGGGPDAVLVESGAGVYVVAGGRQMHVAWPDYDSGGAHDDDGDTVVRAPMHGKVLALYVEEGDTVARGDRLAIVEAMKMEHAVLAGRPGTIAELAVKEGDQVGEGARLAVIHGEE